MDLNSNQISNTLSTSSTNINQAVEGSLSTMHIKKEEDNEKEIGKKIEKSQSNESVEKNINNSYTNPLSLSIKQIESTGSTSSDQNYHLSSDQKLEDEDGEETPQDEKKERRLSCHRCGNIRKRTLSCSECPHIYCLKCADKMKIEHGSNVFSKGCPVVSI